MRAWMPVRTRLPQIQHLEQQARIGPAMDCRSSLFASVTYVSNRAHAGNQADRVSPPVTWQAKKKAPLARGFPSLPGPLLAYGSEQVAVRGSQVGLRTPGSRSEERRVGKECVSTCRSRWSP